MNHVGSEATRNRPIGCTEVVNEAAVEAFLAGRISLVGITRAVAFALEGHVPSRLESLDDIFRVDGEARRLTEKFIERGC